jgi:hypothetical protein
MTFAVISVAENREKIIGTIWASGETEAQQVASSLFTQGAAPHPESDKRILRRAEQQWEIPLRMRLN